MADRSSAGVGNRSCYRGAGKMKNVTKVTFLVALVAVTVAPVIAWLIDPTRDLSTVAAFVAAAAAPMGVLTGAMAARGISRDRQQQDTQK